ncbi:MAG: efflux RND transporter periplasmic adaptor subunit [Gammaproteobacteria bacterium]|nr:efflux RND transporter periplasmic adaptor subunit [Gammaproteobacteria bacterium]MCB1816445.1 efflux RND transporter periplasmic adaptor subunit [Gammaproteobacteria bacterium]MCW5585725.1 efflux RND transporter periplasmic adaptor subunit [Chromatiales bacterium]HOP15604.1 efflux RND transporter periplasmic adaptor subunit [Gammaproteobacteria bacterium]HPQ25184.1 efflux RND transporter periplasmic adaptor subunit [Gammaproteobacteria bacterium]
MKLIKSVATAVFVATFGQASALDNASGGFKVHEVSREAIPLTVSFAGTVTADKTLQLTAQMPGRIAEIAGKEGDRFGAGTVLVELDDSALLARLEAAIASRDSAAADIRNARVQFDRELYSPRSNSAGSAPGGMGMPAMMDQMFANPMQNMMGMRDRGTERTSDLVGAETQLAQATTRYKTAEANIREIQSMLRDTKGVAQFSGVIQKVHVEVGDTVQPGQPLLDFSESAALVVEADLPVRLSRTLTPGLPLEVAINGDEVLQAPVSRIHPVADPRQNTVRIELSLPLDAGATPGQYVEIRVPDNAAQMPAQLTIPKSAIVTKGGLPLVYAVDREGKARLRVVRLGDAPDGTMQIVLSGVNVGDLLVDQPPPGLRAGTQIMAPAQPETVQNAQ